MSSATGIKKLPPFSVKRAKRLKRLAPLGDQAAKVLAVWTATMPVPYYALIACCFILPVLAIGVGVWIGGALAWETGTQKKYARSLITMLLIPALALFCRALGDFNFLNWQAPVAWSLLVAACIGGAAYFLDSQVRNYWRQLCSVMLFALTFGYASVTFADTLLDPFGTTTIPTTVSDKNIHVGGGAHGSSVWYNVSVAPSPSGWTWIHVRPDIFRQLRIGQRACLVQGGGLLGIGWLEVRPCAGA